MKVAGIDLGTSTSQIAVLENGLPKMIKNKDDSFITPSVVRFLENGETVIGAAAKESIIIDPENTFYEFKREMGTDTVYTSYEKKYTPVDLSALLLTYLVECAQAQINERITDVVITVPAYFTDKQRQATVKAGEVAGLNVLRIINEPTAAALDYGLQNMNDSKNILVYDLGGGTLDVTLLEFFEGIIDVKASAGDNRLGGKDFDEALIQNLIDLVKRKEKVSVTDLRALSRLKMAAEEAKIALSHKECVEISLPFFGTKNNKPFGVDQTITRNRFEEMICDKINKTSDQIERVLSDAGLTKGDIDLVLPIGGSTRIPLVSKFIAKTLHQDAAELVDPELAVVKGAAIQAGIIANEIDGIVITDVCPFTLGTAVLQDDGSFARFCLENKVVFDPLIKRNTTIPVTVKNRYATAARNQSSVIISVYHGEYTDVEKNTLLGEFQLDGVPPGLRGEQKIDISFSYDSNGILHVEAQIVSTGKSADIRIVTVGADAGDKNNVDPAQWVHAKNAKKYRTIIKRTENFLEKYSDDELSDALLELKLALIADQSESVLDEHKEMVSDILSELRSLA